MFKHAIIVTYNKIVGYTVYGMPIHATKVNLRDDLENIQKFAETFAVELEGIADISIFDNRTAKGTGE